MATMEGEGLGTRLQLYSSCSQFPTDPVGVFVPKEVNVSSMTLSSIKLRGCTGVNSGEASRLSWERVTVGRGEGEREIESEKETKEMGRGAGGGGEGGGAKWKESGRGE